VSTIRVGVVGCSNLGKSHASAFYAMDGVEVAALCDLQADARQWVKEQVFAADDTPPAEYDDYATMLKEANLDAVALIVPHSLHTPMCKAALDAGVHVLVEKPLATSTGEAQELEAAANASGKVMNIAFQGPHKAQVKTARRLIEQGAIGDILFVRCTLAQAWLSLIQSKPQKRWRLRKAEAGGGQLYDSGSHLINALLWITDLQPKRVYAEVDNRGEEVDVDAAVTVRFDNQAIAGIQVLGDTHVPGLASELVITGSKGDLTLPQGSHGGGDLTLNDADGQKHSPELEEDSSPQRDFIRAIRGEIDPPCPPAYGVRLAQLMDAVYEAADTHMPVTVESRV